MSYYPFDINNVPEDATHYTGKDDGKTALFFYKKINGNWMYTYSVRQEWTQCSSGRPAITPIPIVRWSIYSNTLPLCELTYEQVGKLVKHSGCVEHMNQNSGEWGATITPMWSRVGVYRIKSKSERELFIEKSVGLMTSETERTMEQMFGAQFDAGARYKDSTQHFGENI